MRRLPSFSVVRHPVERMVSAYKMARSGGTDIMAYSRYWRTRLRGLELFDGFVDHVFANRQRLETLPLDLRSQASFILDPDSRVMVDRLFALSEFRGFPLQLNLWLATSTIPHLNATASYPVVVSARTKRKVEEIYQTDFAIYDHLEARGACPNSGGDNFRTLSDDPHNLRGEAF